MTDGEVKQLDMKLDYIKNDLSDIKQRWDRDISDIKNRLDKFFVTQDQFVPVRNLVYGMVGVIMVAFVGGLAALIWKVAK